MRIPAIIASSLIGFAATADAGVIVQSTGPLMTEFPGSIQKFNPALGTLSRIAVTAQIQGGVSLIRGLYDTTGPITVVANGSAAIMPAFGTTAVIPLSLAVSGTVVYPEDTFFISASASGVRSIIFTEGLDDFVGTGTLQYYALGGLSVSVRDANGPFQPQPGQVFSSPWNGTMRVEYYYDEPIGVPEPSTWTMLISGFGLVGGSTRRRTAVDYA